jgi:predicted nucleic acid-binding protein
MPDFWLDTDTLIRSKNEAYGFDIAPRFWEFLDEKAREGVIASSRLVYDEIHHGAEDELRNWVNARRETLFIEPNPDVQSAFRDIADYVANEQRYAQHHVAQFLNKADPWIIAHANASGGAVVTFESRQPQSQRPKIPDVCDHFDG